MPKEKDQIVLGTYDGDGSDDEDDFVVPIYFPSPSVNAEDIKASRGARRLMLGGFQQ